MELDRKLQHDILQALRDVYPDSLLVSAMPGFSSDRTFMGNLFYLQEHGVIVGGDIREPGRCRSMVDAQITKTGLDFLAADGGLEAILGQQTVKLSVDDLFEALTSQTDASDLGRLKGLNSAEIHNLLLKFLYHGSQRLPGLLGSLLDDADHDEKKIDNSD